MKVVILAGGYGTRILEESMLRPKPMIEIGDYPILHHIMKIYSYYGHNEFIICCGYKAEVIKEYFANYFLNMADVTFDFTKGGMVEIHQATPEPWKVTVVNTGLDTQTGGRIKKIQKYVGNETFLLTYGDGVSDVNINDLIKFHKENHATLTLTAVQPEGRFGGLEIKEDNLIECFKEKPKGDVGWVNGGFFVCEPEVFRYIEGDQTVWEKEPLESIARDGKFCAYKHEGFWSPMDTMREKNYLEGLWKIGKAPWKVWKDA